MIGKGFFLLSLFVYLLFVFCFILKKKKKVFSGKNPTQFILLPRLGIRGHLFKYLKTAPKHFDVLCSRKDEAALCRPSWSPLRGERTAGAWEGTARREPAAARPPGGAPAASPDPGHRSHPWLWVCSDYGTLKFRTKGKILTTSHSPNTSTYICIDSTVFFSICRVFLTI